MILSYALSAMVVVGCNAGREEVCIQRLSGLRSTRPSARLSFGSLGGEGNYAERHS